MASRRPTAPRTRGDGRAVGSSSVPAPARAAASKQASARPNSGKASSRPPRSGGNTDAGVRPTGARTRSGSEATARVEAAAAGGGRPPRLLTVRAAVLFIVVLMAFVLLYSNVQNSLTQQQQNASLRAQIQQAGAKTDALDQELKRWQDPAYVAAQARDRLAYVMPGEVPFRVIDPETVATAAPDAGATSADVVQGGPWYGTLWSSVETAGASATGHEDVPAPADPAPATEVSPATEPVPETVPTP